MLKRNKWVFSVLCAVVLLQGACSHHPPGIGDKIPWRDLPGWPLDKISEAWPSLLSSCQVMPQKDPSWVSLCADAALINPVDDMAARRFFETWFEVFMTHGEQGKREGLITGYYEPILQGSLKKSAQYAYPVFRKPKDLLVVDMGRLYPQLQNMRLRGRVQGQKVVPYFSRKEVEENPQLLTGEEILWVNDPIALFFLHIQGSGIIHLENGEKVHVGYAEQNGHPYVAIGKILVEMGQMSLEKVDLPTIRAWLQQNPQRAQEVLNTNPSYVFFEQRQNHLPGPLGSLSVPLTPQRSIAVDKNFIPLGVPVWVDSTLPGSEGGLLQRLVFAQDTGGAIRGAIRADFFWGSGDQAEVMAGTMKQAGRLYVLLPRRREVNQTL